MLEEKWQNLATLRTLVLMEEIVTKESEILFHPFHCPSLGYCDKVSFVRGHIVVTSRESDRIKNSQKMNMENYFIISIRKLIKNTAHHEMYWRTEIAIIDHLNNNTSHEWICQNILLVH